MYSIYLNVLIITNKTLYMMHIEVFKFKRSSQIVPNARVGSLNARGHPEFARTKSEIIHHLHS